MKTVNTEKFGTVMVRESNGCGDVLLGNEKGYNIYLGYLGYPTYYAVVIR